MDVKFNNAIKNLPPKIQTSLNETPTHIKSSAFEIRIRSGLPIFITCPNQNFKLNLVTSPTEVNDCFLSLCNYSVHSHLNEIKQGFITLPGGHRAGLCATAVYDEFNKITNLKQISSINLRIARQIENASKDIFKELNNDVGKLLIIGPPSSGKTTILKDIALNLNSSIVSIIDTRGEISACFNSIAQNKVGNADIFNMWNRKDGVLAAIKTMSPEYIICDEIGNEDDLEAIKECVGSGVKLIATAHGENLEEIKKRPIIKQILETGAFENIAILKNKCTPCKLKYVIKVSDFFESCWNFNFSNLPNNLWNKSFDDFKINSKSN